MVLSLYLRYGIRSHREMEAVVEYACTQERHQNLVVSDARSFVHSVEIVEKVKHFGPVKEWHRAQDGTSKRVLQEDIKSTLLIECCRRAQKRMLMPTIHSVGNDISN